ncbi:MAG: nuclear transport factor 2 family protein [Actinomycetota bacterium]
MFETREQKIDRLLDEREILACLTTYARGLDRHDVDLIESAFHEDAIDRHGQFVGDGQQLAEWGNELHSEYTLTHQHFLSNHTVEIVGDVAYSEIYVNFVLIMKTGDVAEMSGGRYVDRLERRDGVWKIAERTLVVDWSAEATAGKDRKGTLVHYPKGTWNRNDLSYER